MSDDDIDRSPAARGLFGLLGIPIPDPPPVTLFLNGKETELVRGIFELLVIEAEACLNDDVGCPTKFFDTTSGGSLSREELAGYRDELTALLAKIERNAR